MNNQFDVWSQEKQKLNKNSAEFYINVREIWFTKMGKNIGSEQDGKTNFLRPVLVIKKVGSLFFTVPLSSKGKNENVFYHQFLEAKFNAKNQKYASSSWAILSQVKVMDSKRFTEKMGTISQKEFTTVKEKLKTLLL